MDWSYGLGVTGFVFVGIGTLLIVLSNIVKVKDPNQGWAFILLGIGLVVIFGIGLGKVVSALGLPHLPTKPR
jgi:multisubunit Na+/H+ antiporter MnhB subunit